MTTTTGDFSLPPAPRRGDDLLTIGLQRLVLRLLALLLALIIVGLLGLGLSLLIRRYDPFTPAYLHSVTLPDAAMVAPGNAVSMAGVPVGRVQSISVENGGRSAQALLRLHRGVKIPPKARFVATPAVFSTAGAIKIVPPEEPALAGQAAVKGGERADMADTFARLDTMLIQWTRLGQREEKTLDEVTLTTRKARGIIGDPQVASDTKAIVHNLRSVTGRTERALAASESLLADPSAAKEARETLRSLREVSATSARLLRILETAAAQKK